MWFWVDKRPKGRLQGRDWVVKRPKIRLQGEDWVDERAKRRLKGEDWVAKRPEIRFQRQARVGETWPKRIGSRVPPLSNDSVQIMQWFWNDCWCLFYLWKGLYRKNVCQHRAPYRDWGWVLHVATFFLHQVGQIKSYRAILVFPCSESRDLTF